MAEDDRIELQKNGTVILYIEGTKYSWRRPTMKEYRELNELALRMGEGLPTLPNFDDIEDKSTEEVAKIQEDTNRISLEIQELILHRAGEWFMKAFGSLSDPPFAKDIESLPIWIINKDPIREIIDHWTSVPMVALGI